VKLSLKATIIIGVLFSLMSLAVAMTGFLSLGDIDDAKQLADSKGFAWFWMFLAAVSAGLAAVSWWLLRTAPDEPQG